MMRKAIGWGVAQAYRLFGARQRALTRLRTPGTRLPIVIHAARADEVAALLATLKRFGCLDAVDLTFDDGWCEFKETVRVLEAFGKPAILFVAPGEIARGTIWTEGLSVPGRQALYGVSAAERDARLGAGTPVRRLLTAEEIAAVARHPLVRIGNHTWSHLSCPHRPVEEVLAEIDRAQETLTAWCGVRPVDFAYPFGRGTPELDAAIRQRGLTPYYTRQGFVTAATRGAARNMVYEGMSLAENVGRVLMAWPKVGTTR